MWFINFLFAEALLIWCICIWFNAGALLIESQLNHHPTIGVIISSAMLLWLATLIFCVACVMEEWAESQ